MDLFEKFADEVIEHGSYKELDRVYIINKVKALVGDDDAEVEGNKPVVKQLVDLAVKREKIPDDITSREVLNDELYDLMTPIPSQVNDIFWNKMQESSEKATDWFYKLCVDNNYVKKEAIARNIVFDGTSSKGHGLEITINLSKPEKDPKAIAAAAHATGKKYPQCALCLENEGYIGGYGKNARSNLRIIRINVGGRPWGFQYSPYAYFNEHCIFLDEKHIPMVINQQTLINLVDIEKQFPKYFVGSNADLPIVGGSILSHDHYQGGNYEFPIQGAEVLKTLISDKYPSTLIEVVKWPLSTVRLTSENKEELVALSVKMLDYWRHYNAPVLDIISHTGDIPHNTITPIARRKGDKYQIDLVLRNNRTSTKYPDGIFHPHQESHHIKKENIGLIEVMGLAILPARLKDELKLLSDCLLKKAKIEEYPELDKHHSWYQQLLAQHEFTETNIDEILKEAVAIKFVNVLEDAGVFKMDDYGIDALTSFVETVLKGE